MKDKNNKRRNLPRWLRWGCGTFVLLVALLAIYLSDSNLYDNTILNPIMKGSMLSTTRQWARLAPIPESAENFTIETDGGMFTREFNASFHAPLPDIKQWLDASPGTVQVVPADENSPGGEQQNPNPVAGGKGLGTSGIWYYQIEPAEGAATAKVWVDVQKEEVRIQTYWS